MGQGSDRIERLIAAEVGECCAGDVEDRLGALERLADGTPADVDRDLRALKTLGDDTRYRLARLLAAADGDLCVCEITPLFDVSESAVSHALSDLTDAGLVARRKDGTWRYYGTTERAERLLAALEETREVGA